MALSSLVFTFAFAQSVNYLSISEIVQIPPIVFNYMLNDNPLAEHPKFLRKAKQIAFRLIQAHTDYPAGLMYLVIPSVEYDHIALISVGGVIQPRKFPAVQHIWKPEQLLYNWKKFIKQIPIIPSTAQWLKLTGQQPLMRLKILSKRL